MTNCAESRTANLMEAGATPEDAAELLRYAENKFRIPALLPQFPLHHEPFVEAWRSYAALTAAAGSLEPLTLKLVQLAFPVETGMSEDPVYQSATRRGAIPADVVGGGAPLRSRETCRVSLHDSFAGGIGVITAEDRMDFETLVRVFTAKNEPIAVRPSMGASMISGYNNWHRIALLKTAFLRSGGEEKVWPAEFSRLKARKELYQDRFILLSRGPYSGVSAQSLGLEEEEWTARSRTIRLEHEYAHYFTRRVFGSMQNNLLDEMLADYAGLRQALGSFRAEWMLRFLGLESYPAYREGGRLQNYRGAPALGDGAFRILMRLVWQAAWNLAQFDRNAPAGRQIPAELIAIASMTLDELSAASAPRLLAERYMTSAAQGEMKACRPEGNRCEKHSTF